MSAGDGSFYSVGSLDLGTPLGSDTMYMRGQDKFNESSLNALEAAESQIDATSSDDDDAQDDKKNRVLCATPFYSSFNGRSNDGSMLLVNADDFTMKRTGGLIGFTKIYSPNASAGALLGYSQGKMSQNFVFTKFANDFVGATKQNMLAELNVDDFQFGANFKHKFDNQWVLDVNALGGSQAYKWTRGMRYTGRRAPMGNINEYYKAKTTGNTFSANVALSRTFDVSERWSLTPCAGLESSHSWFFGAAEKTGDVYFDNYKEGVNIAYRRYELVDTIQFSRNTARFGASIAYDGGNFGVNGKAFYGTVLGGNDSTTAHVSDSRGNEFTGEGGGYGCDTLKLGGGFWATLDEEKTATIGGSYDATIYKRAISQTVSGVFTKSF